MTSPMTITFQIKPFDYCDGCILRLKNALGKLDDVKMLAVDPDKENFTIFTTEQPEVIKHVVKREFPERNVTIKEKIIHSYPVAMPSVDDIAKALVTMSQVKGLESVEYTQSNTFRFNFINRHNQSTRSGLSSQLHNRDDSNGVHLEHARPPSHPPPQTYIRPTAPSPPPPLQQTYIKPTAPAPPPPPQQAYIRPTAPAPPPPPPQTYIRSTAPPPPPPTAQTYGPSAPPITPPDSVYGYPREVYGYPQDSYGFKGHPRDSCTIL